MPRRCALEFGEPVDVLGLSTGGSIAQQLAADHPDVVRRLVLISTGCRLGPVARLAQRRVAARIRAGAGRQALAVMAAELVPRWRGRYIAAVVASGLGPRWFPADDLCDMATTIEAEDGFDLADCPTIASPTLLIAGGRDRFYDLAILEETAALIPGCRLSLYPRRGHITVTSSPRTIAEALGFLSEPSTTPLALSSRASSPGAPFPAATRLVSTLPIRCYDHNWRLARGEGRRGTIDGVEDLLTLRSTSVSNSEALVFDAIRTPRGKGKVNGSLHTVKPVDLVVGLMHETLIRNERLDPKRIDDVVLGCVSPIGDQGADIAKTAAIKAGLPDTVAGVQLNRFCASGLEAVNIAAQKVASGWEDLVFAGGVESMSRVPIGSDGGAWAMDPETNYDTSFIPQGVSADLIATIGEFSREDVDAYAAQSQQRAAAAQSEGKFKDSVIPVLDINDNVVLDHDEFIRPATTVETLAGLKPSFQMMGEMGGFDAVALQKYHWIEKIEHVHTPGNSSGIVDGASLVTIGNKQTGHELGLTPRARILATAVSGADPTIMLTGPAPASRKALQKAGLTVDDLDLVEINEAFAAVVMRFVRDMGLDMSKVNVNGGAIAMGHPLGATGAMILGTLIDELHRTGGRYGLATLCVGGGMGIATVVEAI